MADVSNEMIYEQLLKQSEQVGVLTATVGSLRDAFEGHVLDDKQMATAIGQLKTAHDRQSGVTKVLGVLWTAVATFGAWQFWKR